MTIAATDAATGEVAASPRATAGRRRVLLAPVTITPAKPLTPSHLKGLLWADVMYRATRMLADVTYRSSHRVYDVTEQTACFWQYLDRALGDTDYSAMSEEEIGEHYVSFRQAGERMSFASSRPYIEAVERDGWVHPASARILELWTGHYARLGLHDPGLLASEPPGMTIDEMVDCLSGLRMCLDMRGHGGPVYLDATRDGMPLRTIIDAEGRPNYMACALRDLLPIARGYDAVLLLHDRELQQDYTLLHRVLSRLGARPYRMGLGRVPVNGQVCSARHGGWRGLTAGAILDEIGQRVPEAALRLGMRLYFVAILGAGDSQSFRDDLLIRCLRRAERMVSAIPRPVARAVPAAAGGLAAAGADGLAAAGAGLRDFLGGYLGDHGCVDPYRLTSCLLDPRHRDAGSHVLPAVFT